MRWLLLPLPPLQLALNSFPQEVGLAFALFQDSTHPLQRSLRKPGNRLLKIYLLAAHLCCYHLLTMPDNVYINDNNKRSK